MLNVYLKKSPALKAGIYSGCAGEWSKSYN